jgi:hypothetical protein
LTIYIITTNREKAAGEQFAKSSLKMAGKQLENGENNKIRRPLKDFIFIID